jgi:hypothetical protein
MTDHPITPPPDLIERWDAEAAFEDTPDQIYIATQAARWGADQELEACCEWLSVPCPSYGRELRAARRPKPPSLKEQSIALLDKIQSNKQMWQVDELNVVRQALEQLDD